MKTTPQATHTPGPWHVGAQNDTLYVIAGKPPSLNNDYPVHDAGRVVIAKVYPKDEANARLIAAAPELLSALKSAKEHLEYCGYGDKWEREYAEANKLEEKIDEAIAKAEGRE
jgi:hypothetical protein